MIQNSRVLAAIRQKDRQKGVLPRAGALGTAAESVPTVPLGLSRPALPRPILADPQLRAPRLLATGGSSSRGPSGLSLNDELNQALSALGISTASNDYGLNYGNPGLTQGKQVYAEGGSVPISGQAASSGAGAAPPASTLAASTNSLSPMTQSFINHAMQNFSYTPTPVSNAATGSFGQQQAGIAPPAHQATAPAPVMGSSVVNSFVPGGSNPAGLGQGSYNGYQPNLGGLGTPADHASVDMGPAVGNYIGGVQNALMNTGLPIYNIGPNPQAHNVDTVHPFVPGYGAAHEALYNPVPTAAPGTTNLTSPQSDALTTLLQQYMSGQTSTNPQ